MGEYYLYLFILRENMVSCEEREEIKHILDSLKTKANKTYGQNFLIDNTIADRIVNEIPKKELKNILEVGPGLGVLTLKLLEMGANIKAVEKDPILSKQLEKSFSREIPEKLRIWQNDILDLFKEMLLDNPFIVSNLPFNISSKFTGKLLDVVEFKKCRKYSFSGAIIMFQHEFARRLISDHGSKEYGRITVMFRSKMNFKEILDVPRNAFYPIPKVDGKVIYFEPKKEFNHIPRNEEMFSKLVNVVFLNRRKKMKNSVNPRSIGIELDMDDIKWLLEDMDIANRRPEELPPETFIELSNQLFKLA
jgi:16S rRNA (adenine1518-N6/adenine1519-N6)-dimethyltransferase